MSFFRFWGGLSMWNKIGLSFIGAVVLALGYELLTSWMGPDDEAQDAAPAET